LIRHWRNYCWRAFAGDIIGGAVAALIALPYGLAMANLMGLPPMLGLLGSLITAPITAFLGCNPVLIGGPSSVTVPFIAAAVRDQGLGGAAKVCLCAAMIMLVFSVMRLGRYVYRAPNSVMAGFSCGIGVLMVTSQLSTMFGLRVKPSGTTAASQLLDAMGAIGGIQWTTTITAGVVIAIAALIAWRAPRLPAPLLGVGVAVAVSGLLAWKTPEIGRLPVDLPPFANFTWGPQDALTVLPSACGLAFVASVNLLITSRVVEHFRGSQTRVKQAHADRELGVYGIANSVAGLFGAPTSVGIPARSLANIRCGGSTRLSNFVHAAFLLMFVTLGAGVISRIPICALAGVTAWVGLCLMDWGTWKRLPRMRRVDAAAFVVTMLGVICFNAVAAIVVGTAIHMVDHLDSRFLAASRAWLRNRGAIAS
jgi:SulP family sulfate permease